MFSQFSNSRASKSKSIVKLLTAGIVGGMLLSPAVVSAEELYYDDGTREAWVGGAEGLIRAVRFTVTEPIVVTGVKFLGYGPIKIHIWDQEKEQVFVSEIYSFLVATWQTIDLSMKEIPALSGDFFVGVEFAAEAACLLGIDKTSPDSRTYGYDLSYQYDYDAMIRVFVEPASQPDVTAPVVSDVTAFDVVFGADATVTATATDAGSNIKSAEYALDGGAWTAMSATDGAFDSKSENLTATISGLSVKTSYKVCVKATDVEDNISDETACDRFDVTPAQLSIAFAGQELDLDGAPTQLKAEVTGPCSSGAEVSFSMGIGEDQWEPLVTDPTKVPLTDDSGEATLTVVLPIGVHDIKVEVDDQDMDGDDVTECKGDTDIGITVVADPKASSTGGGWYKIDGLDPPRVNFGYTAQRKYNKKLDEYSTSGNLLWMHQDSYRLKGAIDSGGMLPEEMCDPEFAACAAFAGEGTLYEYNEGYSPLCPATDICGMEWINPSPNTPFVIFVNDGGTSRECVSKKKCKDVEKPDQFGIEIALESIPAESKPVYLNGGNLVVR